MKSPVLVPLGSHAEVCLNAVKARFPRLREWSLGAKAEILETPYRADKLGPWGSGSTLPIKVAKP